MIVSGSTIVNEFGVVLNAQRSILIKGKFDLNICHKNITDMAYMQNKECIVYYVDHIGTMRYITEVDFGVEWSKNKKKAFRFKNIEYAMEVINHCVLCSCVIQILED